MSWWISALGKSFVKGCTIDNTSHVYQHSYIFRMRQPTTISPTIPYLCQSSPSSRALTAVSVCSRERFILKLEPSRLFLSAVQLGSIVKIKPVEDVIASYTGHQDWTMQLTRACSG